MVGDQVDLTGTGGGVGQKAVSAPPGGLEQLTSSSSEFDDSAGTQPIATQLPAPPFFFFWHFREQPAPQRPALTGTHTNLEVEMAANGRAEVEMNRWNCSRDSILSKNRL